MIIIKTNNGDRFINENYALEVEHNKSECQVRILPAQWGAATPPQGYVIKDVEQVTYTTKDTEVKDTGSEIERLQKRNSELWKLKEFYRRLTQKYECFYHNIISNPNDIKDKLIQLQADIKEINDDFEKKHTTMKKNEFIHRTIIALCFHPAFPNITRDSQIEYAQLLADDTEKAVPFDDTPSEAEENPDYSYLKDLLDRELRDFDLKVRTVNALFANDIKTVRDLVKLHKPDVLALRNVSRHALWELEEFITNKGLRWGMEV